MNRSGTPSSLRRTIVVFGATAFLLCASLASAAPVLSSPHFSPVTATGLYAVATADFNRDGRQDIVVAGASNNTLSVLYGKKGGGFEPSDDHPAGVSPLWVATADLNHDHRPDIAVADDVSPGTVTVLLSKHGGFQAPDTYSVGDDPVQLALADFNRDGNPDIATANDVGDNVSILLGRRNGTFKQGATLHGYSVPDAIVASDLNHDHKTDLAVLNETPGGTWLQVFLGKGDGSFKAPHKLKFGAYKPQGMVAGRFAGDSNLDLAVPSCAGSGGNKVYVLTGTGKGSFKHPRGFNNEFDSCSEEPAATDLNHDGREDIVTNVYLGTYQGDVSVLFGKRGGKFTAPKYFPATGSGGNYAVAVGRLNRDNKPDLVVPDSSGSRVGVLYGKG